MAPNMDSVKIDNNQKSLKISRAAFLKRQCKLLETERKAEKKNNNKSYVSIVPFEA